MVLNEEDKKWHVAHYTEMYEAFGYSPKALGWTKGKQDIRFDVLTSQINLTDKRILDIGCGFGDLNKCLKEKFHHYAYLGIDLLPAFIEEAKRKCDTNNGIKAEFICGDFLEEDIEGEFDYAVASGIFNYKLKNQNNYDFVNAVMAKSFDLCKEGIAFDFLSDKVDYTYPDNFNYDPAKILSMAYTYTRNVVLRNDYMPFEFSIFLFKDDSFETGITLFNKYIKDKLIPSA